MVVKGAWPKPRPRPHWVQCLGSYRDRQKDIQTERERETDRWRDGQTDRETARERKTDGETDRWRDRQMERQTDGETARE